MHIFLNSDPRNKGRRPLIILMSLDPDLLFTVVQRRGEGNQPQGYLHWASACFEVLNQLLHQLCPWYLFDMAARHAAGELAPA